MPVSFKWDAFSVPEFIEKSTGKWAENPPNTLAFVSSKSPNSVHSYEVNRSNHLIKRAPPWLKIYFGLVRLPRS
jgi:hypothetical protein